MAFAMFLKLPHLWILWISAFPLVSAACGEHRSLGACLAFRHQDRCAWDVAAKRCVPAKGCEARASPMECESELTTGSTGATWDDTQNQCFWDLRLKQCRWSDECFALGPLGEEECLRAQCSWRKVCTPQDMTSRPGPNVCLDTCRIPSADVPLMPNATRGRAERAMVPKRPGSSKVVHTSTGPVQGNQLPGVAEFLGIPFAQAPVEQRRWAPSEKMESWNQIFQATEFSAACAQQGDYYAGNFRKCQGLTRGKCLGYSEDCLTLNIWSPNAINEASVTAPKAVLFWIHGGCYVSGSAADAEYNATELAQKQDVVVVSVQYRLGVFGFLGSPQIRSRDPKGSTGNYGLMDNIAALQWVQQNIAAFGGDPNRVTIFGESSGAGSVSLLLGVKESWPYYHGAIMESGTGSFWSYITMEAAEGNWQQLLTATKCRSEAAAGADGLVACILSASSRVLTDAVDKVPCRDGCTWAPVLDGVLLRGTPVQLAKAGLLRPNTPSISGFNKDDGAMFVTGYPISMVSMSQSSLDSYFSERYGEERKSQLQQLFPPTTGAWWISKYFQAAQACETDFSYSCTAMWISTWSSPSFVYKFSQPDSQGLTLHGDEIPYIFGTLESPSSSDLEVSQWMMKYWANFAKTGDPNGPDLPQWPAWQESPASLLNISDQPVLAEAPNNSWPGCGFFLSNWDFYSLCLPGDEKRSANLSQIMV